ncbi:MAG: hypothetical protein FWC97_03965 [Treponema sp.]|nr:hypothetical protein [Treponema sp.]
MKHFKIVKTNLLLTGLLMVILGGCNNFFHDLIPSDNNRILSFSFDGQIGRAQIGNGTINALAQRETDLRSVIPSIAVSSQASILPLTLDYIQAAFPDIDLVKTAMELFTSNDLTDFITNLITDTPDFDIPALSIPINFSGPVHFVVISGQGSARQYTITINSDSGDPQIQNFAFSKFNNPELIRDAHIRIAGTTIIANALYPAEMDNLSYALIPTFEILGDKLEINGVEIINNETAIQFLPINTGQAKVLTVTRDGVTRDYNFIINFSEDPDSIRSITDFRFTQADNPDIAATVVSTIINSGGLGTITTQVFYYGARPTNLTPRFITPGSVTVSGLPQVSGANSHDFSPHLVYRVVSRNGLLARNYTVKTEFINVTNEAPRMLSFGFSQIINNTLVQDTTAEISDGLIIIDVRYGNLTPEFLIPEFSAEGIVTVSGSVQISGFGGHDFSRQIKYTVTNPQNPLLSRDYWVQARITQDPDSRAEITAFGFFQDENPTLNENLIARVDQVTGRISVIAPVGSGARTRIMYPRFEAHGQVSVAGYIQSSGISPHVFESFITYTVVSANGQNVRHYTVEVRELSSPMFVNSRAVGLGDGTSWENAFLDLRKATEAAALFHDSMHKEIWIAAGTYTPGLNRDDFFLITPNTSYIGGFAGHETNKSQRDVASNQVIISGYLGGGMYSYNLFASGFNANDDFLVVEGNIVFQDLIFSDAKAIRTKLESGGGDYSIGNRRRGNMGAAILARLSETSNIHIIGCTFRNLTSGASGVMTWDDDWGEESELWLSNLGMAIHVITGNAFISDTNFYSCGVGVISENVVSESYLMISNSGIAYFDHWGDITLRNVRVENSDLGIHLLGSGNITVEDLYLRNIASLGLSVQGHPLAENQTVTARHTFSHITTYNVGTFIHRRWMSPNSVGVNINRGSGFTLQDSTFDSSGQISLTSQRRGVYVINTTIRNSVLPVSTSTEISALNITSGNVAGGGYSTINGLTIDRVSWGNALRLVLNSGSSSELFNSVIRNRAGGPATSAGILVWGSAGASLEIANTRLYNTASASSLRSISLSNTQLQFRWQNWYNGILLNRNNVQHFVTNGTFHVPAGSSWEAPQ